MQAGDMVGKVYKFILNACVSMKMVLDIVWVNSKFVLPCVAQYQSGFVRCGCRLLFIVGVSSL